MATFARDPLPDVILHLGAGQCAELATYLVQRPNRIVLVEANPDEARGLRQRVMAYGEVEVFSFAVSASNGLSKLNIYNISSCSSIRRATGLLKLFPGLRSQREIEVDAVSISDFVRQLGLDIEKSHWLVLDVPGGELDLIRSLKESGCIDYFGRITVHCSFIPLYEGSVDVRSILAELVSDGYEVVGINEHNDADLVICDLRKSVAMSENLNLKRRLDEQIAQNAKHEDVVAELVRELVQLRSEKDRCLREMDEERRKIDDLVRAQQDRDDEIKELQSGYGRMKEECASREEILKSQRGEIERLIRLSQDASRSLEQHKVRVAELKRDLDIFKQTAGA